MLNRPKTARLTVHLNASAALCALLRSTRHMFTQMLFKLSGHDAECLWCCIHFHISAVSHAAVGLHTAVMMTTD